jgi:hypothetical protein
LCHYDREEINEQLKGLVREFLQTQKDAGKYKEQEQSQGECE